MNKGKVAETVLKRSVFKQFQVKRDEVLIGPGIGEDCSVIKLEPNECMVLSTDPITGASSQIGELAVHITLNDLAASGATPIGLMVTLLLPVGYREQELKKLMFAITQLAKTYKVQIIGGHTEVTDVVNQPVVSITGVGKIHEDKVMLSKKLKPGMDIIMTKWAGIEGTSIIAHEGEKKLATYYNESLINGAKELSKYLSVVKDSEIAMKYNVYAMHDVTEGGIYGALWEIGAKAGLGMLVDQSLIPILQETVEICEYFDLDPYKLIGSGSLLIVTDQSNEMIKELEENQIKATVIGKLTSGTHRQVRFEDVMRSITPAKSDELYKALDQCN